MLSYLFST